MVLVGQKTWVSEFFTPIGSNCFTLNVVKYVSKNYSSETGED